VLEVSTLSDGGQTAVAVAEQVAAFLGAATHTLDLACYDLRLEGEARAVVDRALADAAARGVRIRVAYNVDHPGPIPVPPPPTCSPEEIAALPAETRAIAGVPDLMHHKYVVRDGNAVWTGSLNWTNDSWTRQENVVVRAGSAELAYAFSLDFEQLWSTGVVEGSGRVDPRPVEIDGSIVRPWFTPDHGEDLSQRIARRLARCRRRIRIASPVLTSGPILATMAEVAGEGRCDVAGVVDQTQVTEVFQQRRTNGVSEWKIPLLAAVLHKAPFSGKPSTPWSPDGSVHDFMHAKCVVCDDVVFAGSFNLSRSGERNAENVLEIESRPLADTLAAFVDSIRARYPPAVVPADRVAHPRGAGSSDEGHVAHAPGRP
jgi:phosphatidylserine/phosphatidylglycerophosphate/cardiolipin synthase-like enzyme